MDRLKLKSDAKLDIRGKVFYAFSPFAILLLIEYGISIFASIANTYQEDSTAYIIFTVIYAILSVAYTIVNFPLNVGIARFFLLFVRGERPHWSIIFDSFRSGKQFGNQLLCYLIEVLTIAVGLVCLIIPGIYLAMRFSQTAFIFAENPDMSWKEVIKRSFNMMKGHTWEYFVLVISFFGWYLLESITYGIASIYVSPYVQCSLTRYYRSLSAYMGYDDAYNIEVEGNPFVNVNDDKNPFEDDFDDSVKQPDDIDDNPFN